MVVPLLNLYPYVLLSSIALSGLRAMQKSRGDRASPWYIPHLIVMTSAILFEFADKVVL